MISVIMLTYNREKYISQMIECILNQTYTDFEFIIVDNGSSDRSAEIAESYATKDKRIRLIKRNRGTIGAGRNTGLDAAKGEFVAFVDDDDICTPDYLEFLHDLMTENNADISICGATWSNRDEKKIMDSEEALILLLMRKHYNVAFPTKMFRRSLFDDLRFDEDSRYDDIYLMPKMLSAATRIAYHGLSKYEFVRHETNNSAWTQHHELLDNATLCEYLRVYEDRTRRLIEKYPAKTADWNYFNLSFMISMVEKVSRYNLTECFETRAQMIKVLKANAEDFMESKYIQEFEKQWMREYVG